RHYVGEHQHDSGRASVRSEYFRCAHTVDRSGGRAKYPGWRGHQRILEQRYDRLANSCDQRCCWRNEHELLAKIWGTIEGAPAAGSTFIINAASTSGTTATLNIRRGSGCTLN